jgi:hypothetical protein
MKNIFKIWYYIYTDGLYDSMHSPDLLKMMAVVVMEGKFYGRKSEKKIF